MPITCIKILMWWAIDHIFMDPRLPKLAMDPNLEEFQSAFLQQTYHA